MLFYLYEIISCLNLLSIYLDRADAFFSENPRIHPLRYHSSCFTLKFVIIIITTTTTVVVTAATIVYTTIAIAIPIHWIDVIIVVIALEFNVASASLNVTLNSSFNLFFKFQIWY